MEDPSNNNNNNPKPHALCFPFPVQSHIKAMLKLSKLLHHKGFHITFVNTEFNQKRFLKITTSLDSGAAVGFRFVTVPDGLPPSDPDATQDIPSLCDLTRRNFSAPLLEIVAEINDNARAAQDGRRRVVSCLVLDGFMSLAVGSSTAKQLGNIPLVKFYPVSANAILALLQFRGLLERGIVPPISGESSLTDGSLDNTLLDWVPAAMKGLKLRDLPSFWRITDSGDPMFNYCMDVAEKARESSAVVIQTFDALERDAMDRLSAEIPNLYAIGPLQLLLNRLSSEEEAPLRSIPYSLWEEEPECLKWLDSYGPGSVVYVNFGSITVLTPRQVADIGWGIADSGHPFLWVIRPDLVEGKSSCLSREFMVETRGRGLVASWCPQEEVLNHQSVGGFLTHCGWNSIVESMSSGVPLLCYPFFADQQTNCWLACNGLGVGVEIDRDIRRDQVEGLVRDLLEGEKGKKMKNKSMLWKELAGEATGPLGSSSRNFDSLVDKVLLNKLAS